MHEILYELREHSAGLNCGRWDYIFSYIKKFREQDMLLPDRNSVTMTVLFMRAYSLLTIKTCHQRGAQRWGGWRPRSHAATIPSGRVRQQQGARGQGARGEGRPRRNLGRPPRDGLLAKDAFDEHMPQPNQLDKIPDVSPSAEDLLEKPEGNITMDGFRNNISVGVQYIAAWPVDAALSPSSTSWRTRRPRRSAAPRCGSGSTTREASSKTAPR